MTKTQTDTVIFRPDSRDGRKDYLVPREVAVRLFKLGVIYGDATNGGYMPNPSMRYDMRKHKVETKEPFWLRGN